MDIEILRKKISTFRGEGGRVRITDDTLYMEILSAWEQWKGPIKEFYRAIDVSKTGMAGIIGKAKKMRREGHFPVQEFKEVKIEGGSRVSSGAPCNGIEVVWLGGQLIRFPSVEPLLEFLKKTA
jgi:hypothetical protein